MAWLKRAPRGATPVEVLGKPVTCPHCGGDDFMVRSRLLNTAFATLLGFDFANRQATTLMCSRCGQILWFGQPPKG